MRKFKIMIIDDRIGDVVGTFEKYLNNKFLEGDLLLNDADRKLCKEVLKYEFEIIHPRPYENLDRYIENNKADAYLLDVLYSDDCAWNLDIILSKIRLYNENAPIFVYSRDWTNMSVLKTVFEAFRQGMPGKAQAYQYDLSDIVCWVRNAFEGENCDRDSLDRIADERKFIRDTISKAYGMTGKDLFLNDGRVAILHISDIQYGDDNTTEYTLDLWQEVARKCKELKSEGIIGGIDILVVSGDIAMHGRWNEFKAAKDDMDKLCSLLWPDEKKNESYRERIILVPGNHDYDLNYCAMDYFKVKNIDSAGKRKVDFEAIREELIAGNRKKIGDYHDMGMSAFKNFAYQMTKNPIYYNLQTLDFIENKFLTWNLQFVCLNSCDGINADGTNDKGFDRESLTNLINSERNEECYSVAVSHHSPLEDGTVGDGERAFHIQCQSVIRTFKTKVWLGGHNHEIKRNEVKVGGQICNVYEAPTIRLDEKWGRDKKFEALTEQGIICSNRGFEVIIINTEKKDESPQIHKYLFDENGNVCKLKE